MSDIDALIEKTNGPDSIAEQAVGELIKIGMPVIEPVINAIRHGFPGATWRLCIILREIKDSQIIPVLLELINDENSDLAIAAFLGLSQIDDAKVIEQLQEYLVDSDKPPTRRALSAEALGNIGKTVAIDTLNSVAAALISEPDVSPAFSNDGAGSDLYVDEDMIIVLIKSIVALAKMGKHDFINSIILLSKYSSEDPYSEDEVIRSMAVDSMQYTVGLGVVDSLMKSIQDEYYEVREKAIEAMFYIGTKECICELVKRLEKEDSVLADNILVRVSDLTGLPFQELQGISNLYEWWSSIEKEYESGICYRLGKPINLEDVIILLEIPHKREQVIKELRLITGESFGLNEYESLDRQNILFMNAKTWWTKNCDVYKNGCLYKYGYEQDLKNL
ncbi:MAG: HEAT repeat domain-containing protein [Gammaproteobacteria bacterium]|nr:HEAT repeat domain-containing protein [Gammaproteobacteria bacterium]